MDPETPLDPADGVLITTEPLDFVEPDPAINETAPPVVAVVAPAVN